MNDVIILVGSLDRYSGAWAPFCHGMHKYWPDCPYPIYFITNKLVAPCGVSLKVGGDRDWSANTRGALERIEAPVVLWMQEEHWLYEQPATRAIVDFGRIVVRGEADHIRIIPGWRRKTCKKGPYEPDPRLCIFANRSTYRTAAHAAFWNVKVFLDLIRPNETVWQFENAGSVRSRKYENRFLCVAENKYIRYVMNAKDKTYTTPYQGGPITKGKWSVAAKKYARHEKLGIDFRHNPDGSTA